MTSASLAPSEPATAACKLVVDDAAIRMPRSMAAVLTLDGTPSESESCALSFFEDGPEGPRDEEDTGVVGAPWSLGMGGESRKRGESENGRLISRSRASHSRT